MVTLSLLMHAGAPQALQLSDQLHPMPATAAGDNGHSSPFAAAANTAAVSSHGHQSPLSSAPTSGTISDADAAAITAAEGGDDLTALPDAGGRTTSATAAAAGSKGLGAAQDADDMPRRTFSGRPRRKKMIPLKRVSTAAVVGVLVML